MNPGGILKDDTFHIFYRAFSADNVSSLGYAAIDRRMTIAERPDHPMIAPEHEWEEFGCEDPRITRIGSTYYLTYTAHSRRGPRVALACGEDIKHLNKIGVIGPDTDDKDAVLFPEIFDGKVAMIHRIEPSMQIAFIEHSQLERMSDQAIRSQYWADYFTDREAHVMMKSEMWWEEKKLGAGPPPVKTPDGWLIIYHGVDDSLVYRAGAILTDLDDPRRIVAKTSMPILEPKEPYEMTGFVRRVVFPEAAMVVDGTLYVFYGGGDSVSCVATVVLDELLDYLRRS